MRVVTSVIATGLLAWVAYLIALGMIDIYNRIKGKKKK